jgi:hypothetical protein
MRNNSEIFARIGIMVELGSVLARFRTSNAQQHSKLGTKKKARPMVGAYLPLVAVAGF